MSNDRLRITTEGNVLCLRINMDAYPLVREAFDVVQTTAAAPQLTMAALALLMRAVGMCAGDPRKEILHVPGVCANEKSI